MRRWGSSRWALALLIIGTGLPHLTVRAWILSPTPAARAKRGGPRRSMSQLISGAFGAGLAGVVVNTAKGGEGGPWADTWHFTVLAAAGVIASLPGHAPRPALTALI